MIKKQLFAALLLSAPVYANATILSGYGAAATAWTADNCPSYLQCLNGAGIGQAPSVSDGGEFVSSATAYEDTYAMGQSLAELTGDTYLPVLKAQTSADPAKAGYAMAFGSQGFTYSGTTATTVNLNINLHGVLGIYDSNAGNTDDLVAAVAVIIGSEMAWYTGDIGLLSAEIASGETVGLEYLTISPDDGLDVDVNTSTTISFNLNPGTDFFVVASLTAHSLNGYANGWNTLTMAFDDNTGLKAASAGTVPEPAALWLFGTALVGLAGVKKRKKA